MQALRSKISKFYLIKLKIFYKINGNINQTKWWLTEREMIFTNFTSDRRPIFKIYKELIRISYRKN